MPDHNFLAHLIITYAIALTLVVVLARARVPAIVAMMITGVVAGPSGLAVIPLSVAAAVSGVQGVQPVEVLSAVCASERKRSA